MFLYYQDLHLDITNIGFYHNKQTEMDKAAVYMWLIDLSAGDECTLLSKLLFRSD